MTGERTAIRVIHDPDMPLEHPSLDVLRSAVLSDDGLYRYRLDRWWGAGPRVAWIMLNPSTADADVDDPTIRRCIGLTRAWGYDSLTVVNAWPVRATHPREAKGLAARLSLSVLSENVRAIFTAAAGARLIVAAWGANLPEEDERRLLRSIGWAGFRLYHLGLTKGGHPRHPLYVRGDTLPSADWSRP